MADYRIMKTKQKGKVGVRLLKYNDGKYAVQQYGSRGWIYDTDKRDRAFATDVYNTLVRIYKKEGLI